MFAVITAQEKDLTLAHTSAGFASTVETFAQQHSQFLAFECFQGIEIRLYRSFIQFNESRNFCNERSLPGYLLSVNNTKDFEFIGELTQHHSTSSANGPAVYLGLHDAKNVGRAFKPLPFSYVNTNFTSRTFFEEPRRFPWAAFEPDDSQNTENCAQFDISISPSVLGGNECVGQMD